MKRRGDLNEREKRFVAAFIKEPNGAKAAILAGYSRKTAKEQASRLLTRDNVNAEIEKWRTKLAEHTKIDAAYVLRQLVELYERCMQDIRPLTDRKGDHQTDDEGKSVYAFNAAGAAKALELIAKHVSVGAFKDRGERKGEPGKPISLALQQFLVNAICAGKQRQPETWRDAEPVN